MNSKLYHSQDVSAKPHTNPDLDECIATAWLNLVVQTVEAYTGDDWLPLCPDINEGEIYRDWFLWYDAEVTQEWEAYDPITNQRHVHVSLVILKTQIDEIEQQRFGTESVA
ncbi:MAG: hypothetical protein ACRC8A_00690 [Microcoleaceae cyanobacterium]